MLSNSIARLRIRCPDQPGIVAAITGFLYHHGTNITELDQHSTDPEGGTFLLRLEFQSPHLEALRGGLERSFAQAVAQPYQMEWCIAYATPRKRMAILVSRYDHVLLELLWRHARGELVADIPLVISNHLDLQAAVASFGIPYVHIPNQAGNRDQAESEMLARLAEAQVDLIVLARYMQILRPTFVENYPRKIINIHHSFLPAFMGAQPYRQAYERGVKLIGATAHFVTDDLDQGPIIDQDVARVSHRESIATLQELGMNIERVVLARAVKWFLEDRILMHEDKTVVFV